MKIATINIPDEYLNCIEDMVNLGIYPSRSECVREALKLFLVQNKHFETTISDRNEFQLLLKRTFSNLPLVKE